MLGRSDVVAYLHELYDFRNPRRQEGFCVARKNGIFGCGFRGVGDWQNEVWYVSWGVLMMINEVSCYSPRGGFFIPPTKIFSLHLWWFGLAHMGGLG